MLKLFKVYIETYHFGKMLYSLFVLAHDKIEARRLVYQLPSYRRDDDAEITDIEEIDLSFDEARVI